MGHLEVYYLSFRYVRNFQIVLVLVFQFDSAMHGEHNTCDFSPTKSLLRPILWPKLYICVYVCMCVCVCVLVSHMQHMEVTRLGVELELHLLAYTTATAMQDPSCICDWRHSSWQHQILKLLSKARDQTHVLRYTSQVHNLLSHNRNSYIVNLGKIYFVLKKNMYSVVEWSAL